MHAARVGWYVGVLGVFGVFMCWCVERAWGRGLQRTVVYVAMECNQIRMVYLRRKRDDRDVDALTYRVRDKGGEERAEVAMELGGVSRPLAARVLLDHGQVEIDG